MTFPVLIQLDQGQFAATLAGAPDVRASASTREEALAALGTEIQQRIAQGELVALDVGQQGLSPLAGKYRDDPTLRAICEEAYQQRDAGCAE